MTQHARGPHSGVVANKNSSRTVFPDALHHGKGFGSPCDQGSGRVDFLNEKVSHGSMGIVDNHLSGACIKCALNGRVSFAGHKSTSTLIIHTVRRSVHPRLNYTRYSFDIARNKDLHLISSFTIRFSPERQERNTIRPNLPVVILSLMFFYRESVIPSL